jgi:hypothetical protein
VIVKAIEAQEQEEQVIAKEIEAAGMQDVMLEVEEVEEVFEMLEKVALKRAWRLVCCRHHHQGMAVYDGEEPLR